MEKYYLFSQVCQAERFKQFLIESEIDFKNEYPFIGCSFQFQTSKIATDAIFEKITAIK